MAFQKFGKFIFPVVATVCSLDVLSSAFNDSYYDITEQISVDLTKEGFPNNVKNVCTSEIRIISARDILNSSNYIDYFIDNVLVLRQSHYFPVNGCKDEDPFGRKSTEAKAYLDKNFESLEKDYREHLEDAKKYLLSEDLYEIKNTSFYGIEYDHENYEKTGRINLKFNRTISFFSIGEAGGKSFEQLKFYIKPSHKKVDLIAKAQDNNRDSDKYILLMDINLDSMKTTVRNGCSYDPHAVISSNLPCIVTKLTDAEINIFKFDGNYDKYRYTSEENSRWILVDTIPVRWE